MHLSVHRLLHVSRLNAIGASGKLRIMLRTIPRIAILGFILLFTASLPAQTTRPAGVRGVLVISVDGMRPDVMLRADTPNLRALMARGSFTMYARTTDVAITLPSHVSMMTGVTPDKHGIDFNAEQKEGEKKYPAVPTIFQLAKKQGLTTAVASGKAKFSLFDQDGLLESRFVSLKTEKDDRVTAREGARIIQQNKPQVMLLHLAGPDSSGHAQGWGSAAQIAVLHQADEAVGIAVAALKEAGLLDSTLIIVSADHGGSGKSHGRNDERSRYIPWIAAGPGVRKDYDLTSLRGFDINTYDTFATACFFMGIPLPDGIDGKPIVQMLESYEAPKPAPVSPATAPAGGQ